MGGVRWDGWCGVGSVRRWMGWDGKGWNMIGCDWVGLDWIGLDGKGREGERNNGMGWDAMR